jgi:hypothetical protein
MSLRLSADKCRKMSSKVNFYLHCICDKVYASIMYLVTVMVDRTEDKDCSTGQFELVYKQPKLDTSVSLGIKMSIEGSAIPKPLPAGKSKL